MLLYLDAWKGTSQPKELVERPDGSEGCAVIMPDLGGQFEHVPITEKKGQTKLVGEHWNHHREKKHHP